VREYKIDAEAYFLSIPDRPSIDTMTNLSTTPSKRGERTNKYMQRKHLPTYWEVLGDFWRGYKMDKKEKEEKKTKASDAEGDDQPHRTSCLAAHSTDRRELTMRQITKVVASHHVVTTAACPATMACLEHRSFIMLRTKHRQVDPRAFKRRVTPSPSPSSITCPA
jgi:hypothetical protein